MNLDIFSYIYQFSNSVLFKKCFSYFDLYQIVFSKLSNHSIKYLNNIITLCIKNKKIGANISLTVTIGTSSNSLKQNHVIYTTSIYKIIASIIIPITNSLAKNNLMAISQILANLSFVLPIKERTPILK